MTRYVHECSELIVEREIPEEQNRKRTEHSLLTSNAITDLEVSRNSKKTDNQLRVMRLVVLVVLDGAYV